MNQYCPKYLYLTLKFLYYQWVQGYLLSPTALGTKDTPIKDLTPLIPLSLQRRGAGGEVFSWSILIMNKIFQWTFIQIFLLLYCMHSQNQNLIRYHGSVDAGFNYNGLISLYSPYPATYVYFNTQQQLTISEVPFEIQARLTNLQSGFPSQRLYPNIIQITYNQEQFKQNLYKKALSKLEKQYENYLVKLSQKNENQNTLKQLDSISSLLPDTNEIISKKIQLLKNATHDDSLNILQEYNYQMNTIRKIVELKNHLQKQQSEFIINDSIQQEYFKLKNHQPSIKELCAINNASKFENIMSNIQYLSIGRFLWSGSNPFISSGITVDGAKIDINIKKIELGGLGGKVYPIIFWNQYNGWLNNFSQQVYGGYLGFNNQTHRVKVGSYLFNGQDNLSIKQGNIVATTEYTLHTKKLDFIFNIAGSQSDVKDNSTQYFYQGLPVIYNYSADNIINNILQQRTLSGLQTGYAFQSKLQYHLSSIIQNIHLAYERVSPFYQSAAAPFIMRDQHKTEIGSEFKFHPSLSSSLALSYRQDNLSHLKGITTIWKTLRYQQNFKLNSHFNVNAIYYLIERISNQYILQNQYHLLLNYFSTNSLVQQLTLFSNWLQSVDIPSVLNIGTNAGFQFNQHLNWNNQITYTAISQPDKYIQNYSILSSLNWMNKKSQISLNTFFFLKDNSLYNRSVEITSNIKVTKYLKFNTTLGYGQNKAIWNEINLINLQNPDITIQNYFYTQLQMILNW